MGMQVGEEEGPWHKMLKGFEYVDAVEKGFFLVLEVGKVSGREWKGSWGSGGGGSRMSETTKDLSILPSALIFRHCSSLASTIPPMNCPYLEQNNTILTSIKLSGPNSSEPFASDAGTYTYPPVVARCHLPGNQTRPIA